MEVLTKLRSLSRSRTTTAIEQVFQRFDVDGSKQLDQFELRQAMKSLGVEVGKQPVALAWRAVCVC